MGWSFRKSAKMGPLRVNFSKGGVGASIGVRGARVGVGPRGTYVSFGAGGFQYRAKVGGSSPRRSATSSYGAGAPGLPVSAPSDPVAWGNLSGASAAELAPRSPEWMVEDLQRTFKRWNLFKLYCWIAGFAILMSALNPVLLGIALAAGIWVYRWDSERRTARLIYDVDDEEVLERLAMVNGAGQWLESCQGIWHIFHAVATTDWKTNAGASTLIRRTRTRCGPGSLPRVELNIEVWCVPVGPQQLLFLPDRLLVWDGQHLAALPYETLSIQASSARFVEEDWVPSDARQVDTTWRFVRRDGGPDLRFNNNARLPVMLYGKLTLSSPSGLVVVLQTSRVDAAEGAARALLALQQRALGARSRPAPSVPEPSVPVRGALPAPETATVPASAHPTPELYAVHMASSVAILMRYLAGADRRIDGTEVAFAQQVLAQLLPPGHPELARLAAEFRIAKADAQLVYEAVQRVRWAGLDTARWVLGALHAMAAADGKTTPKEQERLTELRHALGVEQA